MKNRRLLFLLTLILYSGFAVEAQPQSVPADAIAAPTFHEGDFWRYRIREKSQTMRSNALIGNYEAVYSGGKFELFKLEKAAKTAVYIHKSAWNFVDFNFTSEEFIDLLAHQSVWQYVQFPLFVGKEWKTDYRGQLVTKEAIDFVFETETRVTGIEEVTIPAGTFRAFKIERQGLAFGMPGVIAANPIRTPFGYLYYYSPEARAIVKYNSKGGRAARSFELLRFGSKSLQRDLRMHDKLDVPGGTGPFPAVILLHGCGGPGGGEQVWAERLWQWGYLVLRINSFAPRGIKSVCEGGPLTARERVPDVLAALASLRSRPDVDPKRIAMVGWGHGASTVLMAMVAQPEKAQDGIHAAVAFYPGCSRIPPWRTNMPTLVLLGELDDLNPPGACQKLSSRQQSAGFEVTEITYPGAYSGFDNPSLGSTERRVPQSGGRTATMRHDPAAAEDSVIQVQKFLAKHLQQ